MKIKAPWSICDISETCNRDHNVLELFDILPNFSFAASVTERDYQ